MPAGPEFGPADREGLPIGVRMRLRRPSEHRISLPLYCPLLAGKSPLDNAADSTTVDYCCVSINYNNWFRESNMSIEKRVKREQPASIRIVRNVEATGVPEQRADSKFQFGDGGMI